MASKSRDLLFGELTHTVIDYLRTYDRLQEARSTHVHYQYNASALLAPQKTIARAESTVRDAEQEHAKALKALRTAVHQEE